MKYSKPKLYIISAATADARCVSGSSASTALVCTNGPMVGIISCTTGYGAIIGCEHGHAAATCTVFGLAVNLLYSIGRAPTDLGI